ncbi:DNA double-strand break repair nuclease NurA [Alkalihalobacillus trypoxylicola]|uniref:NurA domain-containing protein n=1 Tax=Alkalihalobacillus trypoxylicola TaxID=519424 RepID=A0A162EMV9_9BACI|nr:DNA double-strand break repair nuclease NurA [Alkalihalobacillus trypoxylicola]KYG33283.1 hypothetical protein AZF04_17095 [Alkalihalobacillus trypoxylicola]
MLNLNDNLLNKIKQVNMAFRQKYKYTNNEKYDIRQNLIKSDSVIRQNTRMSDSELLEFLEHKKLGGVDGSVNQTKGDPPHVLYLFQALAKTTTGTECRTSDIHTPLLEEPLEEDDLENKKNFRSHLLAKLELEAAYQLIEKEELRILLMDGALYHYRIDAPEEWEKLREKALEKGVLLVGVSEEITTQNLVKLTSFSRYEQSSYSYDRDILFGVLNQGESIYIEEIQQKAGLQSVWMRLSQDPAMTSFDVLEEQGGYKDEITRLLFTLTPESGRGIPLWLDHIDREVRITDKLVEALLEQYIDSEFRQRFFNKKRNHRPY